MIVWTHRAASPTVRVAVPALIGGLAIPVALYLSNPWLAILAVTICACGVLAALPGFWALPTAYLTGAAAAAGIGLINSLGNLSGFVAPYVTGALSDATGNNRLGLWVVGVLHGVGRGRHLDAAAHGESPWRAGTGRMTRCGEAR